MAYSSAAIPYSDTRWRKFTAMLFLFSRIYILENYVMKEWLKR